MWYQYICSPLFSFFTKHACDRRTDGQTHKINDSNYCVCIAACAVKRYRQSMHSCHSTNQSQTMHTLNVLKPTAHIFQLVPLRDCLHLNHNIRQYIEQTSVVEFIKGQPQGTLALINPIMMTCQLPLDILLSHIYTIKYKIFNSVLKIQKMIVVPHPQIARCYIWHITSSEPDFSSM